MTDNPFEVLRLAPDSSEEVIVRQAGLLRQRATDEVALTRIRQAVQALTARPEARALLALQTHPRPTHRWPALERFAVAFRRPPAGEPVPCPPLDVKELRELLLGVVAQELELAPPAFEAVPDAETEEEIKRQTAEALWQSLLADMRG